MLTVIHNEDEDDDGEIGSLIACIVVRFLFFLVREGRKKRH